MHFGCIELVDQHCSTRTTRRARLARHVERVEWCRDVTSQVEFGLRSHVLHIRREIHTRQRCNVAPFLRLFVVNVTLSMPSASPSVNGFEFGNVSSPFPAPKVNNLCCLAGTGSPAYGTLVTSDRIWCAGDMTSAMRL